MLKKIIDKEYWLLIGNKIIKRKVAQASGLCILFSPPGATCPPGKGLAIFLRAC
jgi:hypothetical protein